MFNKQSSSNWMRWVYTAASVAIIAIVFSFPAARAAASNVLGLFRVQKFAPISISPEQLANLENLDLEGLYPGEFVWLDEPSDGRTAASLDEASEMVGNELWLRGWSLQDELGAPDDILIMDGGSGQLTVDLPAARAILNIANADPSLLPDSLDGADITVTTGPMVEMVWGEPQDGIMFMQTTSPEINYPDDFDPASVGEALLQVLGYTPEEAYRVSRSIDWTNTLIMPIPQDMATFTEVTVAGTSGILITSIDSEAGHSALMWESSGQVNMLSGSDADQLLALVADW